MPQLDPSSFLSQIFWLALVFGLLYIFMSKFFVPRIGEVVNSRRDTVKSNLEQAEKMLENQKHIKDEISEMLEEARKSGANIKNAALKKAEISINEAIAKVESEISRSMVAEEQRLASLKAKMSEEVSTISDSLSQEIIKVMFENSKNKKVVN